VGVGDILSTPSFWDEKEIFWGLSIWALQKVFVGARNLGIRPLSDEKKFGGYQLGPFPLPGMKKMSWGLKTWACGYALPPGLSPPSDGEI